VAPDTLPINLAPRTLHLTRQRLPQHLAPRTSHLTRQRLTPYLTLRTWPLAPGLPHVAAAPQPINATAREVLPSRAAPSTRGEARGASGRIAPPAKPPYHRTMPWRKRQLF